MTLRNVKSTASSLTNQNLSFLAICPNALEQRILSWPSVLPLLSKWRAEFLYHFLKTHYILSNLIFSSFLSPRYIPLLPLPWEWMLAEEVGRMWWSHFQTYSVIHLQWLKMFLLFLQPASQTIKAARSLRTPW